MMHYRQGVGSIKEKKGKEDEKDCKENGKEDCQELERSQRADHQDFGLQSLKRFYPPKKINNKHKMILTGSKPFSPILFICASQ